MHTHIHTRTCTHACNCLTALCRDSLGDPYQKKHSPTHVGWYILSCGFCGLSAPPFTSSPPFLRRMPFQPQHSQFILACDRHQVCWVAYLEACFTQWLGLPSRFTIIIIIIRLFHCPVWSNLGVYTVVLEYRAIDLPPSSSAGRFTVGHCFLMCPTSPHTSQADKQQPTQAHS